LDARLRTNGAREGHRLPRRSETQFYRNAQQRSALNRKAQNIRGVAPQTGSSLTLQSLSIVANERTADRFQSGAKKVPQPADRRAEPHSAARAEVRVGSPAMAKLSADAISQASRKSM
jgi:hypothetical protein